MGLQRETDKRVDNGCVNNGWNTRICDRQFHQEGEKVREEGRKAISVFFAEMAVQKTNTLLRQLIIKEAKWNILPFTVNCFWLSPSSLIQSTCKVQIKLPLQINIIFVELIYLINKRSSAVHGVREILQVHLRTSRLYKLQRQRRLLSTYYFEKWRQII